MKYSGQLRFIKSSKEHRFDPDEVIKTIIGQFSTLPENGGSLHFVSPDLASVNASALGGDGLLVLDNIKVERSISGSPVPEHETYRFKSNNRTYVLEITEIEPDEVSKDTKIDFSDEGGL